MKTRLLKVLFLLLITGLATAEDIAPIQKTEESPLQEVPLQNEFVYIQQSKEGTLAQNKEGFYTLTLKGNNLDIIYFADQPNRITGHQELSPFFDSWAHRTQNKDTPPTAFINYTQFSPNTEEGVTPDILQLRNPKYDFENDTITFEVMPLHEYPIKQGAFENIVIIYDKE